MTMSVLTEAEWQGQVIDLARIHGWHHLHVRRSIGRRNGERGWQTATNIDGWPDLFLWHEGQRRVMAVEVKSETGRVTAAQEQVLGSLTAAGIECHVWRPADLDAAQAALRRRAA